MTEPVNLNTLEKLLETMDPETIRLRYAETLAAHPECRAMLDAFDALDDDFNQLKTRIPSPPLPQPKKRRAAVWVSLALPLAALVVLAVLLHAPEIHPVVPDEAAPMSSADAEVPGTAREEAEVEALTPDVPSEAVKQKAESLGAAEPSRKVDRDENFDRRAAKGSAMQTAPPAPKQASPAPAPPEPKDAFKTAVSEPEEDVTLSRQSRSEDERQRRMAPDASVQPMALLEDRTKEQEPAAASRFDARMSGALANRQWLDAFFGAWQDGRVDLLADLFEPDAQISWPLRPEWAAGPGPDALHRLVTRYRLIQYALRPGPSGGIPFSLTVRDVRRDETLSTEGIFDVRLTDTDRCEALVFRPLQ